MSLKFKRPYIFSVLLFVFIAITICSCKKEKNITVEFIETNTLIEDSVLVEINLIKATSNNSVADKINKKIEANIIESLQLEIDEDKIESIDEAINSFKNQYAYFNNEIDENTLNFEATFDAEVLLNSPELVCIALTSYINTGGAHGNSYIKLLNFDVVNSKQILSEELIREDKDFSTLFKTHFIKHAKSQFQNLDFDKEYLNILPENIGFNEEGVLFLYNNYELDFLGQEIFEFVIPLEEIDDYLNYQP